MAEWLIKKLTGQDLMDKAWDLVVAEENANIIVNALRPELQDIEEAEIMIREAELANQRADELQRESLALRREGREQEAIEAIRQAAEMSAKAAELAGAPVVIKVEGDVGAGGALQLWQSNRFEEENITVVSARKIFRAEGVGKLTEAYINHSSSNSFGAELIVDGHRWYDGDYTSLAQKSISDSHLAVYQDATSNEYIIQFSGVNFLRSLEIIVTANNLTFDVFRVNYEMLVDV